MNSKFILKNKHIINPDSGKIIEIELPDGEKVPVELFVRPLGKNIVGSLPYGCSILEIDGSGIVTAGSWTGLYLSGDAIITMHNMGYDLADKSQLKKAKKDRSQILQEYKRLLKNKPELFSITSLDIEKGSSKNQKDLSRFEKENNLEYQKAKDITIKYGGKVDDFLRDEEISENLLEALYDENIDYWFNNVDKFDLKYSLRYIVENKNASKILLKKVFEFREKNILEDELHVHYQDLGSDICTYLKDYDWGRKLFKQAKEETFKEEVWSEYERYPTSLAFDVCTKLGDKVWGKELFKEAEKYCKDVYFAEKLSRVFASDDPNWCKEVYISNINDQKNQNVVALCEIGGSIAAHGLNDKVMAKESFQKAESMLTHLTDYLMLAGCVVDKDGLNDKKWSQELFQKGLILYCSDDYKEHPNAKDYGFTNEIDYIISCIGNDGRYIWNVMKDWLDTIETISEKLGNGFSKKDAVVDYLDDEYKEKLNSENSDKHEIDNVNEDKYINYDEVNWVNPPGWEQDAPYVDGRPFTGIVYENYPNGQTSVEDQYTDGIRHGRQTKFYENGYVHWEKIYEYNKFVKWSVKINDTKEDQHKPIIVSDGSIKSKVDNQEEPSVADSSEKTPAEPVESSVNPVEDFRSFLASKYPTLKLPKGKKYVEFPIGKGMLVCCMVKKDGVNVYLYSGGKVPAREVFDKLNSLGVTGKVINKKYTITPMPGSRNPNVVRIDLLVPYDGRDLNSNELCDEVNDVYNQLLKLCKGLI